MNKEKSLAAILRNIADPNQFQIATQFTGRSINPRWPNSEIVVAWQMEYSAPGFLNVVVPSSGVDDLDQQVCNDIVEANSAAGCRVIHLSKSSQPNVFLKGSSPRSEFIISIGSESDLKESAKTILSLSKKPTFNELAIEDLIKERLESLGFRTLRSEGQSATLSFQITEQPLLCIGRWILMKSRVLSVGEELYGIAALCGNDGDMMYSQSNEKHTKRVIAILSDLSLAIGLHQEPYSISVLS